MGDLGMAFHSCILDDGVHGRGGEPPGRVLDLQSNGLIDANSVSRLVPLEALQRPRRDLLPHPWGYAWSGRR